MKNIQLKRHALKLAEHFLTEHKKIQLGEATILEGSNMTPTKIKGGFLIASLTGLIQC